MICNPRFAATLPFGSFLFPFALAVGSFCCAAPLGAQQLPVPNDTEKKNIQMVIDNLDALLKKAAEIAAAEKGMVAHPPSKENASGKRKIDLGPSIPADKEVLQNLKNKLAKGGIHPIPGLSDKDKDHYSPGEPNDTNVTKGHPRAAFCIQGTQVLVNNKWIPCPDHDIVIDPKFTEPHAGQPIDETSLEGWKEKWTLLHILVHEKWHERIVDEKIKEAKELPGFKRLSKKEKKNKIDGAIKKAIEGDNHQKVYKEQQNILWLEWEILRRKKEDLEKNHPDEKDAIKKIQEKMDWLKGQADGLDKPFDKWE
jgi:hypothetical protein